MIIDVVQQSFSNPLSGCRQSSALPLLRFSKGEHTAAWRCRQVNSTDLTGGQDGRRLGGVTLVNPFASPRSPLLLEALGKRPLRTR